MNLFPVCEESPPHDVNAFVSSPFARHREPGDAEQHEVDGREPGDDTAGRPACRSRSHQYATPSRRAGAGGRRRRPRSRSRSRSGVVPLQPSSEYDPLGDDPHHDVRRGCRRRAPRTSPCESNARSARRQAATVEMITTASIAPNERHRAEHVQEERPERAAGGDHRPGLQIIEHEDGSAASPASHEIALPRRSRSSARSSSFGVSPAAASRSASLRASAPGGGRRRRRARRRSRATARVTAQIQKLETRSALLVHRARARRRACRRPADADQRQRRPDEAQQVARVSLGRSARSASVLRIAGGDRAADEEERAVMCSISSHWNVVTGRAYASAGWTHATGI